MPVSAKTMKLGLDIIKPLLKSGEAEHRGIIVIGNSHFTPFLDTSCSAEFAVGLDGGW